MNVSLFKYFQALSGYKGIDTAKFLGIAPKTLSKKLHGESDFTRKEIAMLKNCWGLSDTDCTNIFYK